MSNQLSTTDSPIRLNARFIKASEIQQLFNISKREYNDILVNNIKFVISIIFIYLKFYILIL